MKGEAILVMHSILAMTFVGCITEETTEEKSSGGLKSLFPVSLELSWAQSDCLSHAWSQLIPSGMHPLDAPQGWNESSNPVSLYAWNLRDCEHFEWGPFSRGPVRVVWEFHQNFEAPDACWTGAPLVLMSSVFFDDAEIAAYARERFGMPAYYADIQIGDASFVEPGRTWTITTDEGTSTLSFQMMDGTPEQEATDRIRLAWPHNGTLRALDNQGSGEGTHLLRSVWPAVAEFGPPSGAHAGGYEQAVAQVSNWSDRYNESADLALFTDMTCQERDELEPRSYEGWSGNSTEATGQ